MSLVQPLSVINQEALPFLSKNIILSIAVKHAGGLKFIFLSVFLCSNLPENHFN